MREKPASDTISASLAGVTKLYPGATALDDVDFALHRGELVALLGPNGAGKTTTVRLLLGLTTPSRGSVAVFGADPRLPKNRVRSGALLQVGRVPETLRVGEHIELFSSYYPSPLPTTEVVHIAGLEGLEGRRFGHLSGGQKQRLLFALAICGDPDLLLLDEPTAGLDVESRRALWRHIRAFVGEGRSVLLTTHYLEEADALADRIAVINSGKIIAQGSPNEIKSRACGRRIRCSTHLPVERLRSLASVSAVRRDDGITEILTPAAEPVVRDLFTLDPGLSDLEVGGAGLEEAFLALTKKEVAS